MLALLLVAAALGLSNLAAAIGIGVQGGASSGIRTRIVIVFGVFEAGMPVLGLLLGRQLAVGLGHAAHYAGGGMLVAVGLYTLFQAFRRKAAGASEVSLGRLLISGFALSVDNLAAGFALGAYHVPLIAAAVLIGVVSVAMSLAGLELGGRLRSATTAIERRGDLAAGLILVAAGLGMTLIGSLSFAESGVIAPVFANDPGQAG
jgi:putative Mn2+ efflux pump MntP